MGSLERVFLLLHRALVPTCSHCSQESGILGVRELSLKARALYGLLTELMITWSKPKTEHV